MGAVLDAFGDQQVACLQVRRERAGDAEAYEPPRATRDRRFEIGGQTSRPTGAHDHRHMGRNGDSSLRRQAGDDRKRH